MVAGGRRQRKVPDLSGLSTLNTQKVVILKDIRFSVI